MLRLASDEYHYDLNPGTIARIWRAGCIIRASLLVTSWQLSNATLNWSTYYSMKLSKLP
jgi:6-phosphogluconate dehydrogenase